MCADTNQSSVQCGRAVGGGTASQERQSREAQPIASRDAGLRAGL